ncbi:Glutathione S-transferase [Seminavis robusta]|uniref:Glutathione S-transferase n=1 Tax=Seminavis robusta TaxID=568900 RepID=A0A9N8EDV3_9STRA|nr:Glutathione S-transferase [Seminavis robusta]|eukprot:Sro1033_g233660.1 Glutathione S-transferase (554) ;mRNA; r:7923-10005
MDGIRRSIGRVIVPILLVLSSSSNGFQNHIHQYYHTTALERKSSSISKKIAATRLYSNTPNNNPFSSLLGDFASSIMGQGDSVSANANLDATLQGIATVGWSEIRSQLESVQTPEERQFRDSLALGYGVGSPMNKIRLYDESNKEEDIRVTFYRDHASWCPYCQKVWFALEEKKIPYRVEKVNMNCYGDKPREFLRLQPNGQIPVAIIDSRTYGQSNDILAVLDSLFPEHKSLQPPAGQEREARELLMLERTLAGAWLGWLRGGGGRRNMENILGQVEGALKASGGPFFMGKDVSIVDVQFLSFLERMCASLLFFKGFVIRVPPGTDSQNNPYPAINQWFDALEQKPSYQLTKSDYYTHCWDLPPQLGGCGPEPEGEPYRKAINGERSLDGTQGSWEFPLQPHNGGIEPDWMWAGDEAAAKREAVERLSFNHQAIVKFAARGAGKKGMPPVMAPLADPNAVPSEAVQTGVETVLQTVTLAMLDGRETHEDTMSKLAQAVVQQGGQEYADGLISSLSYLRDRVGVPRDMKLPAARQLRAHLNWAIGKILNAQSS